MTPNITTRQTLREVRKKNLKENTKKSSYFGKKAKGGKKKPGPKVKSYRILNGIPHKLCSGVHGCKQWLPLEKFYRRGNRYHTSCAECTRQSKASGYDLKCKEVGGIKPDQNAFWENGSWKKIGRHNFKYRWTGDEWVRSSDRSPNW